MDRLARKFETMRQYVPRPLIEASRVPAASNGRPAKTTIGLISIGSSGYAVRESSDQLWNEYHIAVDCLRLRAYPFTNELKAFIQRYERVYVVEQNRDAQLLGLMRLEFEPDLISRLRSVRYYGGLPLDARTVTDEVVRQEMTPGKLSQNGN
jgi:2-oxoglutarate/2-oxoacid ferredoxin oxidoreductase subunit alpha